MGANLQESRDLASLQALINQMNQVTPFGNLTYSGPTDSRGRRDPTQTTVTQTLSPEMQALFNNQVGAQQGFGNALLGMVGRGGQNSSLAGMGGQVFQPTIGAFNPPGSGQIGQFQAPTFGAGAQTGVQNPFNLLNVLPEGANENTFGAQRDQVTQSMFDRAMGLLEPEWQQQDRRREQDMANRGLPISGEAYQTDRSNTQRGRGEAMDRLAMSAVLAGGQEQSRLLGDLLGTSQMGMGQAYANRGQRFGEAMQGYGANLQGQGQQFNQALSGYGANLQGQGFGLQSALANRQVPLNELMTLFGASQGQPPQFMNTPQTPVQSFATSGGMSPMQGALGGATGGAAIGSMFGPIGAGIGGGLGGLLGLFGR